MTTLTHTTTTMCEICYLNKKETEETMHLLYMCEICYLNKIKKETEETMHLLYNKLEQDKEYIWLDDYFMKITDDSYLGKCVFYRKWSNILFMGTDCEVDYHYVWQRGDYYVTFNYHEDDAIDMYIHDVKKSRLNVDVIPVKEFDYIRYADNFTNVYEIYEVFDVFAKNPYENFVEYIKQKYDIDEVPRERYTETPENKEVVEQEIHEILKWDEDDYIYDIRDLVDLDLVYTWNDEITCRRGRACRVDYGFVWRYKGHYVYLQAYNEGNEEDHDDLYKITEMDTDLVVIPVRSFDYKQILGAIPNGSRTVWSLYNFFKAFIGDYYNAFIEHCTGEEKYKQYMTKQFHDTIYDELIRVACHPRRVLNWTDDLENHPLRDYTQQEINDMFCLPLTDDDVIYISDDEDNSHKDSPNDDVIYISDTNDDVIYISDDEDNSHKDSPLTNDDVIYIDDDRHENDTKDNQEVTHMNFIQANINKPWDWNALSRNPSITWDIVRDNPDKPWNWEGLSRNPSITWDIVRDNPDKPWSWDGLSWNPSITWDIVCDNPDEPWDWKGLSQNPSITWDNIRDNPHVQWEALSYNPSITWDIVRDNPDKPWNWEGLSCNPSITWDIVRDNPNMPWDWKGLSR